MNAQPLTNSRYPVRLPVTIALLYAMAALSMSSILTACTREPDTDKTSFTLSTGVTASSVPSSAPAADADVRFEASAKLITVRMHEYFHGGDVKHAWVSLPRHGIATLNVGTGGAGSFVSTKDEALMEVTVQIQRDRLPVGATLSVYNLDTGETLASYLVR